MSVSSTNTNSNSNSNANNADFQDFQHLLKNLIHSDIEKVNQVIRQELHSEVLLINTIAEYIINSGGKRLRPILLLLVANALNYQGNKHFSLAAVIEFIHTATLLHDDVVDESELRRSKPTANAVFGNAASVLVGDFLYSLSFQMMVKTKNMQVMQVLSKATKIISEGEVLQLLNCHNTDVDEENYMKVIHYKTAKLFEASAEIAAILGTENCQDLSQQQAVIKAFADYGMYLGTAFQLIDDVLDYSGEEVETGKHLGDDLAEGKPTLPLIYVMQNGSAEQAKIVKTAIENGGREMFAEVLAVIKNSNALDFTRQQAVKESQLAKTAILNLQNNYANLGLNEKYTAALLNLADFSVERKK